MSAGRAYLADARVVALWKMMCRHVNFGGNYSRFELFDQPGGGVRASETGRASRSRIERQGGSWTASGDALTYASASAFIMSIIMRPPLANLGWTPGVYADRNAHGGVLDGLLTHSPHQPPGGCTAVVAGRWDDGDPPSEFRFLLLTSFDMPFAACTILGSSVDTNNVLVRVVTNEPPVVAASAALLKDRRPATVPLVGGALGSPIADMALSQPEEEEDDEDMDGNGNGNGDGQHQQEVDGVRVEDGQEDKKNEGEGEEGEGDGHEEVAEVDR
ncbi:unnamed protein product [Vitrella brassicaformis CCMP3155]|uniref:Uncharacterized protein n=1 Tax=Vitrella brassicaformis (strain CCMP3155) TaxID=1169540 RepID=A0A0G4FRU1_VITBC|nr:unnamed protein product [Vitrella brassicaformis CCMP3155]|eukprot:CEM17387.1 unnamed protein product [Vitrella brassicaformis CCMP3155]